MTPQPTVFIVDDDDAVRDSLYLQLNSLGFTVETFPSAENFLDNLQPNAVGCLILDVRMPGMSGPELQAELTRQNINLPIIFLTGYGNIPLTVKTIHAGAFDFLTKPVDSKKLCDCINAALALSAKTNASNVTSCKLKERLTTLTQRELEVLELALKGYTNKEIGHRLSISYRTIEHHRSHILLKTGASNLLQLANLIKDSNH